MSELLGIKIKIHALWHAGSYDPQDFLGRLIGDAPWVRHAEKSFYHAIDHNYFATDFHIKLFFERLLERDPAITKEFSKDKVIRTGWPMEYMTDTLLDYTGMDKRDLILFPHRIAPEKQVDIFRDLKTALPQFDFVVCQDQQLTKNEYHNLLGEAKIVFSANLQETLGISCYEGAVVDAIPMVPDRLSYTEMYYDMFKYPSEWTESWDAYLTFKPHICKAITDNIANYRSKLPKLKSQTSDLTNNFFSAGALIDNIK